MVKKINLSYGHVYCPHCHHEPLVSKDLYGKELLCIRCSNSFLAKPKDIVDLLVRNEKNTGLNTFPLGSRKFLFHKPEYVLESIPSNNDILLDSQVEISYDVDSPILPRCGLHLVLDDIRSQWNVGSIFRTSDAAGWASIVLTGITPSPPSPGIMKCALGATEFVPWSYRAKCLEPLDEFYKQGKTIIALELSSTSEIVFDFVPPREMVLVLGNEVSGVSPEALKRCSHRIMIPMTGRKGSLNVAVAFGVAAYSLANTWRKLYS